MIFLATVLLSHNTYAQIITTITGNGINMDSGNNIPAVSAGIMSPTSGVFDSHGNYYFSERFGNKVRKISLGGIISTFAGTGIAGYSGDSGAASLAKLNNPLGLAIDHFDNLFIAEINNNTVRKVNINTGIIYTFAGNGIALENGDGGPATNASIFSPQWLCVDNNNNLYISDLDNRIRKVDAITGIINTIAGKGGAVGFSGDNGPADSAQLNGPAGICTDNFNNLFIADYYNDRIRKVDATTNIIITIAGNGIGTYNGEGVLATAAQLNPCNLNFDYNGNLIVADLGNNRVRKIDNSGYIHTITGNGTAGFGGDNNQAISAQIFHPEGVATDLCGNLYIADQGNQRIRKVWFNTDTIPQVNLAVTPNDTVITGTQVTTTATATNHGTVTSYQWVKNGANASTNSTYTYTPVNGDSVYCIVTVRACTGRMYTDTTTAIHITVTGDAGVANTTNSTIHTYPNPVTDVLHVATTEPQHYVLHNLMGVAILQGSVDKQNSIDMKAIPTGIYLLQLTNHEGQREVVRVVKE
jgi:hypothetical protein